MRKLAFLIFLFHFHLLMTQECCCAYSKPAAVDVNRCTSFFVDGSFIYWYTQEEGLGLAQSAVLLQGNAILPLNGESLTQNFEFVPGFKVGAGCIYHKEWVLAAEYTWLRNHTHVNEAAPDNTSFEAHGLGIWTVNDWFLQTIAFQEFNAFQGQSLSGTHITSSWKLGLDLIDLLASRPYYQSPRIIVTPFGGIRAALIRQSLKIGFTQAPASEGGASYLLPQPIHSHNHSHSWSVGPRVGGRGEFQLGKGWRLEGSGAFSLLATRFTKISHAEDAQSIAVSAGPYKARSPAFTTVLPNADLSLGAGHSCYFSKGKYHSNVSATYDFSLFWAQNAMRGMLDEFWSGTQGERGSLSFQGLTLSACLDF